MGRIVSDFRTRIARLQISIQRKSRYPQKLRSSLFVSPRTPQSLKAERLGELTRECLECSAFREFHLYDQSFELYSPFGSPRFNLDLSESINARSRAFLSSRTFPGQW